jgi:hypothetical protein
MSQKGLTLCGKVINDGIAVLCDDSLPDRSTMGNPSKRFVMPCPGVPVSQHSREPVAMRQIIDGSLDMAST